VLSFRRKHGKRAMKRREFMTLLGGAAAAWPLAAHAQPAMPMVGWMSGRAPEDSAHLLAAFQEGLRETGFVENESVTIEYRWARGQYETLPAIAAEGVEPRGMDREVQPEAGCRVE
jgi:putative ABC transport system substrate-binding protein